MNYFEILNEINCNDLTEKKNNLTYLSWAHAWKELKKRFPRSYYTVYQNDLEWNYFTDGRYCWVKTGVTVVTDDCELEHIEFLPVMDYKNKSIPADMVTSFDVNKAIQRSLTKAVARHGLGLYIYAGEDLPDSADGSVEERKAQERKKPQPKAEPKEKTKGELISAITAVCDDKRFRVSDVCQKSGVEKLEDMTEVQLKQWLSHLEKQ